MGRCQRTTTDGGGGAQAEGGVQINSRWDWTATAHRRRHRPAGQAAAGTPSSRRCPSRLPVRKGQSCRKGRSRGPVLPCPALPCPALPCPALPCPALPCPPLPCPSPRVDPFGWLVGQAAPARTVCPAARHQAQPASLRQHHFATPTTLCTEAAVTPSLAAAALSAVVVVVSRPYSISQPRQTRRGVSPGVKSKGAARDFLSLPPHAPHQHGHILLLPMSTLPFRIYSISDRFDPAHMYRGARGPRQTKW
ncbi:uncharacterized protein PSFLO_07729 [Pseudozyma flocculosa]|uniref:Uncharacterized protein n=1 Tax=Pseudozyma flocculosa TaxID=84751 RepID=A0A5C3FDM2_9BASI|nr:uncharacterized protein PSFLO_07729 [Pseudozyma flocculosa]